jgi:hypothetical protein
VRIPTKSASHSDLKTTADSGCKGRPWFWPQSTRGAVLYLSCSGFFPGSSATVIAAFWPFYTFNDLVDN